MIISLSISSPKLFSSDQFRIFKWVHITFSIECVNFFLLLIIAYYISRALKKFLSDHWMSEYKFRFVWAINHEWSNADVCAPWNEWKETREKTSQTMNFLLMISNVLMLLTNCSPISALFELFSVQWLIVVRVCLFLGKTYFITCSLHLLRKLI
jgi:hypothetical protein